jgi:hypothetical protein
MPSTLTLWRRVGRAELDRVAERGWHAFPPRLPGQPIFYPVLDEAYATMIARGWNIKDAGSGFVGYVLRFEVQRPYVDRFGIHRVGGSGIEELWVPADQLEDFNRHIL